MRLEGTKTHACTACNPVCRRLKTAEEAQVLERLKSINPSLVARLCSRLFFAVNKMDQADESIGLDEEETREYVAEMVTRQLNCPDFRLHPDQV